MKAQCLAKLFGIVFLVVGLLAFVKNPIVGVDGLFATNRIHDLVHIVTGLLFLGAGLKCPCTSKVLFKVFGIVYLLVAILGFLLAPAGGVLLGLVEVNAADNWLHLVLGVVIVAIGFKKCCGGGSCKM